MTGRLEQIEEELKSIGGTGVKGVRNNGVKTASAEKQKQNSIKNSARKQQEEDDDEEEEESGEDESENDEDEASSDGSDSGVSALKEGLTNAKNTPRDP